MSVVEAIVWAVLVCGLLGIARAMWPTRAERAHGYPHDSAEARILRGED